MIFVLTIVMFFSAKQPIALSQAFPDITACQIMEGDTLTAAYADEDAKVLGFVIVNDCQTIGEKATKS